MERELPQKWVPIQLLEGVERRFTNKMNEEEKKFKEEMEKEGFFVLKKGFPDFVVFKIKENSDLRKGEVPSAKNIDPNSIEFTEYKTPDDRLSKEQMIYKSIFEALGLKHRLIFKEGLEITKEKYEKMTKEEIQKAEELRKEGYSIREIAKKIGTNPQMIFRHIKKLKGENKK